MVWKQLLPLLLTGSICDDFKAAKRWAALKGTDSVHKATISIKYPNKDKTPHFSDSLFVVVSRNRPGYQTFPAIHSAPVREVKVDPLKVYHPLYYLTTNSLFVYMWTLRPTNTKTELKNPTEIENSPFLDGCCSHESIIKQALKIKRIK